MIVSQLSAQPFPLEDQISGEELRHERDARSVRKPFPVATVVVIAAIRVPILVLVAAGSCSQMMPRRLRPDLVWCSGGQGNYSCHSGEDRADSHRSLDCTEPERYWGRVRPTA